MIPDYQTLMAPVLRHLADGSEHAAKDLAGALSGEFGLTEDELAQVLPSGKVTVWRSRVHWATQYLSQAGAIARVRRGVFTITDRGRDLLAAHPDRVGNAELEQFPEFRDFKNCSRTSVTRRAPDRPTPEPAGPGGLADEQATPHDRISAAVEEVNETVASELLARINEQPPDFLERVVLDLLVAMGYTGALGTRAPGPLRRRGHRRSTQAGRPRSGPRLRAGQAVQLRQDRGTTRHPSVRGRPARRPGQPRRLHHHQQVQRRGPRLHPLRTQRLVLIDGHELSRHLVAHGVGAQTEQTFILKTIDEGFFHPGLRHYGLYDTVIAREA